MFLSILSGLYLHSVGKEKQFLRWSWVLAFLYTICGLLSRCVCFSMDFRRSLMSILGSKHGFSKINVITNLIRPQRILTYAGQLHRSSDILQKLQMGYIQTLLRIGSTDRYNSNLKGKLEQHNSLAWFFLCVVLFLGQYSNIVQELYMHNITKIAISKVVDDLLLYLQSLVH